MSGETVNLVCLTGQRLSDRGHGFTFAFNRGHIKEAPDLAACDVPTVNAVEMIEAAPHVFYPYYTGIDVDKHHKNTPTKKLKSGAAMYAIKDPKGIAKKLVPATPRTPEDKKPVPDKDELFGLDEPIQMPKIPQSALAGIRATDDEDAEAKHEAIESSKPELPRTVRDVETMSRDKKKLIITLYEGIDIDNVPSSDKQINNRVMDVGRQHGIDYGVADSSEGVENPTGDSSQENPAADATR